MTDFTQTRLRPLAPGILLALLAIAFGFGLGPAFMVTEDAIKGHLTATAEAVLQTAYQGDVEAANAVVEKSWGYFKSAHVHASTLGTSALAAILLLALLGPPGRLARSSALLFGAGALAWGVCWMLTGLHAPELGSTEAAKRAVGWLALPGSGMCLLGLLGTLLCMALQMFSEASEE